MTKCISCNREAIDDGIYCAQCNSTNERSRTSLKRDTILNEEHERRDRLRAARISAIVNPLDWIGRLFTALGMVIILDGSLALFRELALYLGDTKQIYPGVSDPTIFVYLGVCMFIVSFIIITIMGIHDPYNW